MIFEQLNHIYGPIRLSLDKDPIYENLNLILLDSEIIYNNTIVVMVRDPRDILVSFYYSITESHAYSANKEIRQMQEQDRNKWKKEGIEAFFLERAEILNTQFLQLYELLENRNDVILIKYEQMINNYEHFKNLLLLKLDLSNHVLQKIYEATRPMKDVDEKRHRRSGKVGGFRRTLNRDLVELLNLKLSESLNRFQYNK